MNYDKVWHHLNELEQKFDKFTTVRDIIEIAKTKCNEEDYKITNTLNAAISLFDIYSKEWDIQFKKTWDNVVTPLFIKENSFKKNKKDECRKDLDVLDDVIDQAEKFYNKVRFGSISYQEAIERGWEMTDDGFWMPPQENVND
jgi:hypothetical protein